MGVPAIPQTRLVDDLRGATERGELIAHYQPQVALPGQRIVAVEALARWIHPELGTISPTDFIPAAEASGLIRSVGHHMLESAARQVRTWQSSAPQLGLSVNVSPTQLIADDYCEAVSTVLERTGLEPTLLTLEITETLPILDLDAVVECLGHIRDLGVGVSIDDFGAGHTTLEQFRSLPATELKIDQSIIRGDANAAVEVLDEVLREARDRGLRVVAEGVETAAHLELAIALGCDRAQGFLLGAPMDVDALELALV